MNILALDTATRTGWAARYDTAMASGVVDCSVRTAATKTIPADHPGKRFALFRNFLNEVVRDHNPELIVYEAVVGGLNAGGKTSLIQKGLEALVLETAFRRGVPVWSFAPSTLKKWATGSGVLTHESKAEVVRLAVKKWGRAMLLPHKPTKSQPWDYDDNQCDALWLADLAHAVYLFTVAKDGRAIAPDQLTSIANLVTAYKWQSKERKR